MAEKYFTSKPTAGTLALSMPGHSEPLAEAWVLLAMAVIVAAEVGEREAAIQALLSADLAPCAVSLPTGER